MNDEESESGQVRLLLAAVERDAQCREWQAQEAAALGTVTWSDRARAKAVERADERAAERLARMGIEDLTLPDLEWLVAEAHRRFTDAMVRVGFRQPFFPAVLELRAMLRGVRNEADLRRQQVWGAR